MPRFAPFLNQRDAIKSELEDLAATLRDYGDGIDASPARLEEVEDRLALLERLKRKHGPTLSDVLARRDALADEHAALTGGGATAGDIEQRLSDAGQRVRRPRPRSVGATAHRGPSVRHRARGRARRAGHGAHPVRGSARQPTSRTRSGRSRGLTRGSSTSRPISARTCVPSPGLSRAANCRASCSRSRPWPRPAIPGRR